MKCSQKYSVMLPNISMLRSYPDAHVTRRGEGVPAGTSNRFSGFRCGVKTAEAVHTSTICCPTPLKRGVNERWSVAGLGVEKSQRSRTAPVYPNQFMPL